MDYVILDLLKKNGIKKRTRVLDVGCAFGNRVRFLNKMGYNASGIDLGTEAIEFGKRYFGLNLQASNLEDFTSREKFDAILMIDLIEHIRDPHVWIKKVSSLLKTNGVVILFTPDFDCYNMYGERWGGYNMSLEHVFFYNRESMEKIFSMYDIRLEGTVGYKSIPVVSDEVHDMSKASKINKLSSLKRIIPNSLIDMIVDVSNRINHGKFTGNGNECSSFIVVGRNCPREW